MSHTFTVLDIETTGMNPIVHQVTEIGALKIEEGQVTRRYSQLINPGTIIPKNIEKLTGISNEMVQDMPKIEDVLPGFIDFVGLDWILGHNILFDYRFLKQKAAEQDLMFDKYAVDTLFIAKKVLKEIPSRSLSYLCEYFSINRRQAHRAYEDAQATYDLYKILHQQYNKEFTELFQPKQLQYKPKKVEPITPRQKKYLQILIEHHKIQLQDDIQTLTKGQASKTIDHILSTYGKMG